MTGRIVALLLTVLAATLSAQAGGFRIVVVEGEDGVNIIQQKTAVRPLVEVRDRNNLPVPGVLVTFSIEGGKAATFGGASTLTVATNAAGQAAVTGMTPSVAGAFQIQVSAMAQGQVVTATIAQTNVMTAAQAAAATAASSGGTAGGSAGGSAGGGAGGTSGAAGGAAGGGGLSATTIGIVGAAVGGGALVATQAVKEDEPAGPSSFSGPVTGQIISTLVGVETCTVTRTLSGTMTITLDSQSPSAVNGKAEISGTDTVISQTCSGPTHTDSFRNAFTITGSPASLGFREQRTETRPGDQDPTQTVTSTLTLAFQGALSGGVITGTLTFDERSETTGGRGGIVRESATGSFPITLR
jgi:hypothetical protein